VEAAAPGLLYLDLAGLERLFGGEEAIGRRLLAGAEALGLGARVGIAGSRLGALWACHRGPGVTVIEPERERAHLASAPVSLLELPDEMRARLSRWGIMTLGELARLPAEALFERLGSEGPRLHRRARGEDPQPLLPREPPPLFEESIELDLPVETLEALIAVLAALAARLSESLGWRGLAADRLEWSCRLTGGALHEGGVTPAVAADQAPAITALLKAALEARPPRGAVEAVLLRAHPVRVVHVQPSLADLPRPGPRVLSAMLARLATLVGPEQIGVPVLLDTHRPDAVKLDPFSLAPPDPLPPPAGRWVREAALALRRLRPPHPTRVTLAGDRPASVASDRLAGEIVRAAGPWRTSGEWWTERRWFQDEWDVELTDGTLCRLAHDGRLWFLEGIYD
jgi:protein ImuB